MKHKRPSGISRAITNFTFMVCGFWFFSEAVMAPPGSAHAILMWVLGGLAIVSMARFKIADWIAARRK